MLHFISIMPIENARETIGSWSFQRMHRCHTIFDLYLRRYSQKSLINFLGNVVESQTVKIIRHDGINSSEDLTKIPHEILFDISLIS